MSIRSWSGSGLLDVTEVVLERFLTRRVYEITAEGVEVLEAWLDDVELPLARQRTLFLVRVFFGDRMASGRLAGLLDGYDGATRTRHDRYAEVVDRLTDRPGSTFRRATVMFGLAQAQASLDWVAAVRPLLLEACALDRDRC